MKRTRLFFGALVVVVLCYVEFGAGVAEECNEEVCLRQNNCACASTSSPLPVADTPQFLTLSFDDSVTDQIYRTYYETILFNRKNPDGRPISAIFFVPHQYSDYRRVNDLYNRGFEIGVNSISKNALSSYWQDATIQQLLDEFGGERELIAKFANISISDIFSARTPNFQIAGDDTFYAYAAAGVAIDNSWPTPSRSPYFPYTLDYRSPQPCQVAECPQDPHVGQWVFPIVNWLGSDGTECNVMFSCKMNGTSEEFRDWMITQFNRSFLQNRAPINMLINSGWFTTHPTSLDGYIMFLDYLAQLPEVFLVSHIEVLKWVTHPVPLSQYITTPRARDASCMYRTCPLVFQGETRYMVSCVDCPEVYPWVDDPLGLGGGKA